MRSQRALQCKRINVQHGTPWPRCDGKLSSDTSSTITVSLMLTCFQVRRSGAALLLTGNVANGCMLGIVALPDMILSSI